MYFEVKSRQTRVLLENKTHRTYVPGVSPDGKQIALADPESVFIYDSQGKRKKRFRPSNPARDWSTGACLFWSPDNDHILICAAKSCSIYNVKTDKFYVLKSIWPLVFGNSPIRPDGEGFLGIANGDHQAHRGGALVWVDWAGQQTKIKAPAEVYPDGHSPERSMVTDPFLVDSRWNGNRASVRWTNQLVTIDTKSLTADRKLIEVAEGEPIIWGFRFADSGVELRVVGSNRFSNRVHWSRLELFKPGIRKPAIIDQNGTYSMVPSPDRSLVAVWNGSFTTIRGAIDIDAGPVWVVQRDAKIMAKFDP
jgi:hypothetical protein